MYHFGTTIVTTDPLIASRNTYESQIDYNSNIRFLHQSISLHSLTEDVSCLTSTH